SRPGAGRAPTAPPATPRSACRSCPRRRGSTAPARSRPPAARTPPRSPRRRRRGMSRSLAQELRRRNFAGREVSLAEGALVVLGTTALAARGGRVPDAALLAGIGALGLVDDLVEPHLRRAGRPVSKGLRGHLGALRTGR